MKKILLLSTILLSVLFFAQKREDKPIYKYSNLEAIEVEQSISEILQLTGKNFKFHKTRTNGLLKYYMYLNMEDENDDVVLAFYFYSEGENIDLEIKGIEKASMQSVSGKFMTLFPIWKNLVDENANAEEIVKKQNVYAPKNDFINLYKNRNYENHWALKIL